MQLSSRPFIGGASHAGAARRRIDTAKPRSSRKIWARPILATPTPSLRPRTVVADH
jgi:hypothetical protein